MSDVDELRKRCLARRWSATERDDTWTTASPDGSEEAIVRAAGGSFEVRVVRHPTGPSPGPDPEPAHGPRVFEDVDEAIEYAESNLGADT
jgi:hypothetical protein